MSWLEGPMVSGLLVVWDPGRSCSILTGQVVGPVASLTGCSPGECPERNGGRSQTPGKYLPSRLPVLGTRQLGEKQGGHLAATGSQITPAGAGPAQCCCSHTGSPCHQDAGQTSLVA